MLEQGQAAEQASPPRLKDALDIYERALQSLIQLIRLEPQESDRKSRLSALAKHYLDKAEKLKSTIVGRG